MAASRRNLWQVVLVTVVLGFPACSNQDDDGTGGSSSAGSDGATSGGSGGAGGTLTCLPKADSCPVECYAVNGAPVDYFNSCLGEYRPLACYLGTGGEHATVGCVKDLSTQTSYKIPSVSAEAPLFATGKWAPCPSGWMNINDTCP